MNRFYGCRDLPRSPECNANLISMMNEYKKPQDIDSLSAAAKLLETKLSDEFEKFSLIGTAWRLKEKPESYVYHSIASSTAEVMTNLLKILELPLEADILAVSEKKLGYDRGSTIKITGTDRLDHINEDGSRYYVKSTEPLCCIEFATKECDVPKKQSNSTGKGLMITDIMFSEDLTIGELLDRTGYKEQAVKTMLSKTAARKINACQFEINKAVEENRFDDVAEIAKQIAEISSTLDTELCLVHKECKESKINISKGKERTR